MLRKNWRLACTAYRPPGSGGDSHRLISQYHHNLTNPLAWELSTPSRALPVLGVLADSGVLVDGVAQAAAPSFRNMAPCLTSAEVSMLGRVASFFSASRTGQPSRVLPEHAAAHPHKAASPSELVRGAYIDASKQQDALTIPDTMVTDAFFHELPLVESTMLLELFLSANQRQPGTVAEEVVTKLIRGITTLLNAQVSLQFDVVLSILLCLRTWSEKDAASVKEVLASLSAGCARHVHHHLPDITMPQHVSLYLLLLTSGREKPFIVLKAMEDHMLAHPESFADVPTPSMLAVMATPFAQKHPSFTSRLSLLWYYSDRVTDMTPKESLLALYILVHIHVMGGEVSTRGVTLEEWQLVHNYLFAQIFAFVRHFSLIQCVAIFDALEVMNASTCSVHVPPAFAERVKKRSFAAASGIAKRARSCGEVDQALEAFLHFKAALRRCGVLPFSEADENLCKAIETALHRTAAHLLSVSPGSLGLE